LLKAYFKRITMHKHLIEQLRLLGIDDLLTFPDEGQWKGLLELVSQTYTEMDTAHDEDLLIQAERFRLFTRFINDIVVQIDMQNRYVYLTPSLERVLGYKPEEFLGKSAEDIMRLVHPQESETAYKTLGNWEAEMPYFHMEFRFRHRDGHYVWLEAIFSPLRSPIAHTIGTIGIIRDITTRKQQERQQIELAVERQKLDIMRLFIEKASHEFRTPLSIIRTGTHLARRTQDSAKLEAQLQKIDDQVDRLNRLLSDMLGIVSLETALESRQETVNINDSVRGVYEQIVLVAQRRGQTFILTLWADELLVKATANRLQQALIEIVFNAVRYTPMAGKIRISTERDGNDAIISVHDTGIGIEKENLDKIFSMLYREDSSHNTSGFGLGLSVAKNIIDSFGGQIRVQSQKGVGSTFSVVLPLVVTADARPTIDV
jgi:PAS domain S-box-containing protein